MADDFTLKWDAQNQELYGEDPSTGDRIPVPFDSVNINSVNTDELEFTGIAKGTTETVVRTDAGADNTQAKLIAQPTDGVSSSATTIVNFDSGVIQSGLLTVVGDERSSTNRFWDVISAGMNFGVVSVVDSAGSGSPAARSYSISGTDITLSMGSGTYDVVVSGIQTIRDPNSSS